jgi:hypothetical protein
MGFKLDGKRLPVDKAFTAGGINYPANWLRLTTQAEKAAIGISFEADPAVYDQRFYISEGRDKDLTKLKTEWTTVQKETARGLLRQYDWYITRKSEKGTAIPANIVTYRDGIRTVCITREGEINAAANATALKALVEGGFTDWPKDPNGFNP